MDYGCALEVYGTVIFYGAVSCKKKSVVIKNNEQVLPLFCGEISS